MTAPTAPPITFADPAGRASAETAAAIADELEREHAAELERQAAQAAADEAARLEADRQAKAAQPAPNTARLPSTSSSSSAVPAGLGPCGGDLPPCWVVLHESATAGLYSAYNGAGCGGHGCYGKWQFSGEWAGKLGLPLDLSTATPEQQDNAARILWNGGAGCSNWDAC